MPNQALILCVGRELLKGTTLDRNAHFMARRLTAHGFRVRRILVLDDEMGEVVDGVHHALALGPRFVITTGGMGPTFDDMTRNAVAEALGLPLEPHPEALEQVRGAYRGLHAKGLTDSPDITPERERMGILPKGATALENRLGAAPGVLLRPANPAGGETTLVLLPGVPEEMQAMFDAHIIPMLKEAEPSLVGQTREVDYPGKDESMVARTVELVGKRYPGVYIKSHVRGTQEEVTIRITLSAEDHDQEALAALLEEAESDLRARLSLEKLPHQGG